MQNRVMSPAFVFKYLIFLKNRVDFCGEVCYHIRVYIV